MALQEPLFPMGVTKVSFNSDVIEPVVMWSSGRRGVLTTPPDAHQVMVFSTQIRGVVSDPVLR